jgi:hypothetical protein
MSSPLRPQNAAPIISVSFTELLYGVVIGAALQRIELSLSLKNVLLILSLIIVVQDFFFYYHDISDLDLTSSPKNQRLLFVFDMLVLGAWYSLSLAENIITFLFCLIAFFLVVSVWESFLGSQHFWLTHWPIFIIALCVTGLAHLNLPVFPSWLALALLLTVFFCWRLYYYKKAIVASPHV